MLKIDLVAAARPNFMKIAPLWHKLSREFWADVRIIHTGQHYDRAMSDVFFRDLGLPAPYRNLGVGSGSHGQQTGRVLEAYESHLLQDRPDLIIVVGDVNATAAAALAGVKLQIPVAHLEAGLRSCDRTMPEEINRRITDTICDILWTPSEDGNEHLLAEGVARERIVLVGNIMIDTLLMLLPRIQAEPVLAQLGLSERSYGIVTLHRPSNVDDKEQLARLCNQLLACAQELPLVFPLHPRTRVRLENYGLLPLLQECSFAPANHQGILLLEPQPYLAFMRLVSASRLVITDSGGVQEETSYLGIPCLTVRENTERPVTLRLGTNRLVPPSDLSSALPTAFQDALNASHIPSRISLWDGRTADRIVAHLREFFRQQ